MAVLRSSMVFPRSVESHQVQQPDGTQRFEGTQTGTYDDNPVKAEGAGVVWIGWLDECITGGKTWAVEELPQPLSDECLVHRWCFRKALSFQSPTYTDYSIKVYKSWNERSRHCGWSWILKRSFACSCRWCTRNKRTKIGEAACELELDSLGTSCILTESDSKEPEQPMLQKSGHLATNLVHLVGEQHLSGPHKPSMV